jgi:uncharacterized protein YkwD
MSKIKQIIHCFIIISCLITTQQVMAEVRTGAQDDARIQNDILYYVNAYRAKHRLSPLKMSSVISHEATQHSRHLASKRIPFGHDGFNGRIKRLYAHFKECRGGAENVAYYKIDPKVLVEKWVASPGHRRNIEGRYNLTGIGIAHAKKGWAYYTQIFVMK